MFLALTEIRRAKVRFLLLVGAIALLAFLILFQLTIQNALVRSFVGGVRNQTAPILVFNVDGRRFPQGSSVSPELQATAKAVPGIGAVGDIWQGTFPVTVADGTVRATSILGYADPTLGGPPALASGRMPEAAGEAIANVDDGSLGFELGQVVKVAPTGLELTIVGTAAQIGLLNPTVFVTAPTYEAVLQTRNPAATLPAPNVLGVRPADGVSDAELVGRLNAASDDIDALTKADAAESNPAVRSINQSFAVIYALFAFVVPLVIGLFFLILTQQKASSLTLLRAIGAPASRLVAPLMIQVVIVMILGLGLGVAMYAPFGGIRLESIPLTFETRAVVVWCSLLFVLGVISALASVRRVLQIDPVVATTGAGVGR